MLLACGPLVEGVDHSTDGPPDLGETTGGSSSSGEATGDPETGDAPNTTSAPTTAGGSTGSATTTNGPSSATTGSESGDGGDGDTTGAGSTTAGVVHECDPLAQDCEAGGCVLFEGRFACLPPPPPPALQEGEPCGFAFSCEPPAMCLGTSKAGAMVEDGVCVRLCDMLAPDCPPDTACDELLPGTDVGACL